MAGKAKNFEQRVTISLAHRDHERLVRISRREEISVSYVVRRAVRQFLDKDAQSELPLDSLPGGVEDRSSTN